MKVLPLVSYNMDSNSYLVYDEKKTACAVVDPSGDLREVEKAAFELGAPVSAILLTHGHFDHINLVEEAAEKLQIPVYIHRDDAPMLHDPRLNLSVLFGTNYIANVQEKTLAHGDTIEIGEESLQVIHTPGHTPGGVCYYADGVLLSGDTLFDSGIGRTDFPRGSMTDLLTAIEKRLLCLPDSTCVYPGHGGGTTIAREKRFNPFLRGDGV